MLVTMKKISEISLVINGRRMKIFVTAMFFIILSIACLCSCGGRAFISADCDEFEKETHVIQDIEMGVRHQLEIRLCSVIAHEFSWSENADIDDPSILHQTDHKLVPLKNPSASLIPIASATEVYYFKVDKKGTTTIKMVHHDPFNDNSHNNWTYELNVTVK